MTKKTGFSCFDRLILNKYSKDIRALEKPKVLLDDIPVSGTIFSGPKSKGITNNIKKEFKDRGRRFDIFKEISSTEKVDLKLDDSVKGLSIQKAGKNFIIDVPKKPGRDKDGAESELDAEQQASTPARLSRRIARQPVDRFPDPARSKEKVRDLERDKEHEVVRKEKQKLETRAERIVRLEAEIKENLKRMRRIIDSYSSCLFCQQCKTVSVDAQFLLSHLQIIHSEDGVSNSLGENVQHCIARIKRYLRDIRKKEILFNYIPAEEIFVLEFYRCSYCPTAECRQYEELFNHTAAAHNTKVLTCNICHNIFLNYGSLISHVCSGPPTSAAARARFACKVCHRIDLSSFLDFQTHIRKEHNTCEICFQSEQDQAALHAHCANHDQDLMCMKCFVTFEKVESFRKHMFWKHNYEQTDCPSCHCPTWPHVYHFCLPNMTVTCHTCDLTLPTAAAYRVHNRQHLGSTPHACNEPSCSKSFISKSLLWKHQVRRHPNLKEKVGKLLYDRKLRKEVSRFGTRNVETLDVAYKVIEDLWEAVSKEIDERKPAPEPAEPEKPKSPEKKESPLDAAIRSIMPESEEDLPKPESPHNSALPNPDRDAIQATIAGRSYTEDNSWQAGIDALLAGASVKLPKVPTPSDLPPDQLFQNPDLEDGARGSDEEDDQAPVIGGLWNQDLMFVGKNTQPGTPMGRPKHSAGFHRGAKVRGVHSSPYRNSSGAGPRLRGGISSRHFRSPASAGTMKTLDGSHIPGLKTNDERTGAKAQWDLNLSESSDEEDGDRTRKVPVPRKRLLNAPRPLLDHDYCYAAFMMSQEPVTDTAEMDKIVSNVAFDGFGDGFEPTYVPLNSEKKKRKKKKKDKKRRKKKRKDGVSGGDSSDSSDAEAEGENVDMFGIQARHNMSFANTPAAPTHPAPGQKIIKIHSPQVPLKTPVLKRGPKPKYHTPDVAKTAGVTAGTARPSFDTDSSSHGESDIDLSKGGGEEETVLSEDEVGSSDLDTDFSADEKEQRVKETKPKSAMKTNQAKPTLKLKIKLPPQQKEPKSSSKTSKSKKRRRSSVELSHDEKDAKPLSKKMRESLALNQRPASSDEDQFEDSYDEDNFDGAENSAAAANAADSEKLYCYCQCPHDDISEMIGCDAPDCRLEWFHFECVNIMVPPEGKWYCPECTKRYGLE